MRLKKLVILGFKSFADKTTLQFDTGVTCIVGPNGCGKSNISDAFRWVLGEQSAKSMRGNKMPDVIFAGTATRKPLNIAEVSMTLTEIGGALPVDYDEITITRRLHRSGESEYFLNNNPVRLKDIQGLFLDSGMGRNAFSIFEQGKIDQVINYSPVERRYIFEEAAGILRFLQRKREAFRRLEQADSNLSRVKDIHQEVEKQIQVLKQQAEKALVFKENKSLLESLEKACCVARWDHLEKKWIEVEGRQHTQHTDLDALRKTLEELQSKWREIKAAAVQSEKNWRLKSEELFGLRSEKEIHSRDFQASQEQLKNAQLKERKIRQLLEELVISRQLRQKEVADVQRKQQTLKATLEGFEGNVSSQRETIKSKENEVVKLRTSLQAKQQHQLKCTREASQIEGEFKQSETRLESNLDKKKALEGQKTKLTEESSQYTILIQEKKAQLHAISDLVDTHKERLEQFEEELKVGTKRIEEQRKESEQTHKKCTELKARQKVLLRMREDLEGFSSGSKHLLKEASHSASPLFNKIQPFYECIKGDAKSAEALSAILKNYAQTLIVQNHDDFKLVLSYAKEKGLHDYSIFCFQNVKDIPRLVSENNLLEEAASNPLSKHFLRGVQSVETHSEAIDLVSYQNTASIWSVEGGFFDHNGVFFDSKVNENHVFMRETELREIEKDISDQEALLKEIERSLILLTQKKNQLQMERSEADQMLRRDEMKLVEVNFGLQRCLADQEKTRLELVRIEKELEEIIQQIEQLSTGCEHLQEKMESYKLELLQVSQEVEALHKEVQDYAGALQMQQTMQQEQEKAYQQLLENQQQFVHAIHVLEIKESDSVQQQERLEDELEEIRCIQATVGQKEHSFKQFLEEIEIKLEEKQIVCKRLETQLQQFQEQISSIETDVISQQQAIHKRENESHQLSLQAAQYRSTAQSIEQELQERHGLTLSEARQRIPALEKSLDQSEKQIKSLRLFLQEAGDVNMTAIEELEKHQVRYTFINQQMDDMAASKGELAQIIAQLDSESRKLFRETFEAIRTNFQKNFQILFNGGEADLQFTEADNILEAGIEISAKPPGKQMRSISLLSGGEKCLTAVALLFAIFEVRPSPFCILDEIDAPLDDTNVERFVNVVKHFIDRCQFLIITHNKRTMAIGDVLFGVSMQERGVSKLLSLEFAHQAPEAALV